MRSQFSGSSRVSYRILRLTDPGAEERYRRRPCVVSIFTPSRAMPTITEPIAASLSNVTWYF
jgi:hypothetical protein